MLESLNFNRYNKTMQDICGHYKHISVLLKVEMLIKMTNKVTPDTEPCGTPVLIAHVVEDLPPRSSQLTLEGNI